jgi:hypothetical protein
MITARADVSKRRLETLASEQRRINRTGLIRAVSV